MKECHDVDATKVALSNDDVTKNFDILLSIAMHCGKTFIPPLVNNYAVTCPCKN